MLEFKLANGKKTEKPPASVVDVFCGIGGLAHGFSLEGFPIVCGIDLDEDCRYAFEENNEAPFIRCDISNKGGSFLNKEFFANVPRVLVGCAPCQPFSSYNQKNDNPKWRLLGEFGRLIEEARPEIVSMENVPLLTKFRGGKIFNDFLRVLKNVGYYVWWDNIFCPGYGVPQSRTRLVLLASRMGSITLEPPTHSPDRYCTVRDSIYNLPALEAGGVCDKDLFHRSSRLSRLNLDRIKSSKPGGTWRDWDSKLISDCHTRHTGRGYSSVYGRMLWDAPSPTITTQFYGFGNGRFGHPEQNRAISLREGAVLQSFPFDYSFIRPGNDVEFKKVGRMIGNAVPVLLSRSIARSIKKHLLEVN